MIRFFIAIGITLAVLAFAVWTDSRYGEPWKPVTRYLAQGGVR